MFDDLLTALLACANVRTLGRHFTIFVYFNRQFQPLPMATVHKYFLALLLTFSGTFLMAQDYSCYVYDPLAHPREKVVDMQKMMLDVQFVPEKGIVKGRVDYIFTPLRETVDSIFLDAPDIKVSKVTLNKKEVQFTTSKDGITIWPSQPLSWETSQHMHIEYQAQPRKGIYFIGWNDPKGLSRKQVWTQGQGIDNRYWIPSFDDMSDKLITEVTVTFDASYQVLSNGDLVNEKTNKDGTKTWHYAMDKPHAPYLVMIGIGKYAVSTTKSKSGVVINNWYYPEYPDRVEPTYRYTTNMMDFLEQETGLPYPWHEYSQMPVQDFIYGAMENTTATVFGDFYLIDNRAYLDRYYIGTNAHEMTHMWFGDYISARSPEHVWLQESFATHFQKHFERSIFGEDHFQWNRRHELWSVLAAGKKDDKPIMNSNAGSARIYPKGSLVLDMIKYIVGHDQFNKALNYYLVNHPYTNVDTDDFWLAFYNTLGIDLSWFFDEWIKRGGEPNYEVSYRPIPAADKGTASTEFTIRQIQEQNETVGLFKMPIVFEVHYTDGSMDSLKTWIEKETEIVNVPNPKGKAISYVLFDPNSWIIKNLTFKRTKEELIAQLLNAKNMIDRYDALVALRDIPMDDKRDALVEAYQKEPFWAVRSELVSQLINDWKNLDDKLVRQFINDKNARVRETAIKDILVIDTKFLPDFEKLLSDSSYNVINTTLNKLTEYFPDNTWKYLDMTKDVYSVGLSNRVQVTWLEIAAALKPDEYMPKLIDYAGPSYEFRTRQQAIQALVRLNYLDEDALANIVEAMLNPNRRLGGTGKSAIKSYKGQTAYRKMIEEYRRNGTWDSWEDGVWNSVL